VNYPTQPPAFHTLDGTMSNYPGTTIPIDESNHQRAIRKLQALAFLFSQADAETPIESRELHGMAYIIRECVDDLAAVEQGGA
jgi:hypothetical protein